MDTTIAVKINLTASYQTASYHTAFSGNPYSYTEVDNRNSLAIAGKSLYFDENVGGQSINQRIDIQVYPGTKAIFSPGFMLAGYSGSTDSMVYTKDGYTQDGSLTALYLTGDVTDWYVGAAPANINGPVVTLHNHFQSTTTSADGHVYDNSSSSDSAYYGYVWTSITVNLDQKTVFNISHINFDKTVALLPQYPNGLRIPTYGNYGGPDYGGGAILNGGTANFDMPAIDALDETFKTHDSGYTIAGNDFATNGDQHAQGRALVLTDLLLLSQILQIPQDQLNTDAQWFAAASELAFVHKISDEAPKYFTADELNKYGLNDLSVYVRDAAHHIHSAQTGDPSIRAQSINWESINISGKTPINDDFFYLRSNSDVSVSGVNPSSHYENYGWHEGRDPNAYFSTNGYLAANADVRAAGINPLTHYDQFGWKEGRDPSAAFDNELYLARNPDVAKAGIDPLAHYLTNGQVEGRQTYAAIGKAADLGVHSGFDAEYYLLSNTDVAKAALAAGGDSFAFAYQHYETNGWHEGRNPNADFSVSYYLANNTDVKAAGIDPLSHYDQSGWHEGRDPSAAFHTNAYEAANPDVAAAHIDPMLHYLQYGALEGRHLA